MSKTPLPPDVADALAERMFSAIGGDPTQDFELFQDTILMALRQIGCGVERRGLGMGSASRATIEAHVHDFSVEMADQVLALEAAVRRDEGVPLGVVSMSCGLDRKAIPMWEERAVGQPPSTPRRTRHAPYVRAVPKPFDVNYRMAYVASLSLIDAHGTKLRTIRYGDDANVEPAALAARVVRDVERVVELRGPMDITIIGVLAPTTSDHSRALSHSRPFEELAEGSTALAREAWVLVAAALDVELSLPRPHHRVPPRRPESHCAPSEPN